MMPTNIKRQLLSFIMVFAFIMGIGSAFPVSAKIDDSIFYEGINYKVISEIGKFGFVEVSINQNYSGDLIIPKMFLANGTEYTVLEICSSAFENCNDLKSVTIPDSVEKIGAGAFFFCANLTSISIPSSVKAIDGNLFSECPSLISVHVDEKNPNYKSVDGVLFDKGGSILIRYPEGKQGMYAVPNGVKVIADYAFANCDLTPIILNNELTTIGVSAFIYCENLSSLTIPKNVQSIGDYFTLGCSSLISIEVDTANPYFTSEGGVLFNKAKTELFAYPCAKQGSYIVPEGVKHIRTSAFLAASLNIGDESSAVILPSSLESIDHAAFASCTLNSIVIPESTKVLGAHTFLHCTLRSVTFLGRNPPTFQGDVFFGDTLIDRIFIPAGTKALYADALSEEYIENGVYLLDKIDLLEVGRSFNPPTGR